MAKTYGGHIEVRPKSYRITIRVEGERHRFTLPRKSYTKREAERWAADKHMELEDEARLAGRASAGRLHLSTLLEMFKEKHVEGELGPGSRRPFYALFKGMTEFFVEGEGDPLVDKMTKVDIIDYLEWRKHNPQSNSMEFMSPRSMAKERTNLHTLFQWAFERDYVNTNEVARVPKIRWDRPEPVILSRDEYEKLLEAPDDEIVRLYLLLLGETGLRCDSEALWLRWEDVIFDHPEKGSHLVVVSGRHLDKNTGKRHTTKSRKSREVPLSPRLVSSLRQHFLRFRGATYRGETSPWIFHHPVNRGHAKAGDRIGKLRKSFYTIRDALGLPADFTLHDLRHRCCTEWLIAGNDIAYVKEVMGHSTVKVTEYYSHLSGRHLKGFKHPSETEQEEPEEDHTPLRKH